MMFTNLLNQIRQTINNKKGQGTVEYALIIGAVAVIVGLAITPLGPALAAKLSAIIAGI